MPKTPASAKPITLGRLADVVDSLAPFRLAYEWDNVGLQVGCPRAEVRDVLVALEVDERSLAAATGLRARAIIAHHPLIFQPLRTLRTDSPTGNLVTRLVQGGIGLIAAHTNLDRVADGTNGALARIAGLENTRILEPHALNEDFKLVVFVPTDHTRRVIEAVHAGGGGVIGNYSHCTFRAPGTGTYLPNEDANPFVGTAGRLEQAPEDRLEAVVPRRCLKAVVRAVLEAHPYEEVAYDVVPLHEALPRHGLGVEGELPARVTLRALATRLHGACGADATSIIGRPADTVRRVAIITGSAGSSIRSISPERCDVLVTGELSHHLAAEARDRGLRVILLGHAASEKVFAPHFADLLRAHPAIAAAGVRVHTHTDFPEPARPLAVGPAKKRAPAARGKARR